MPSPHMGFKFSTHTNKIQNSKFTNKTHEIQTSQIKLQNLKSIKFKIHIQIKLKAQILQIKFKPKSLQIKSKIQSPQIKLMEFKVDK